ncbi:unnamed protein product [Thlaspi arvense]|uniref:Uncharacterized protein n=1 Tax=Thlaspi arvense TaxID=13288 RepID=A0AAU9T294_THLAR|nr:unnamed protein product [Thlaspi arvense]
MSREDQTRIVSRSREEGNYSGTLQMYKSISSRAIGRDKLRLLLQPGLFSARLDMSLRLLGLHCYPGEDDLAIARSVLMYLLSMGNMKDANFMMDEIKRQKLPSFQNQTLSTLSHIF